VGNAHASQPETPPVPGPRALYVAAGIWLAAFLFLTLLVDVRVFYEAGPWFPCFSRDAGFCLTALRKPGGAVELADAFLAQFDYYGWPSAACLALVVSLLAAGVEYLARRALGGTREPWAYPVAALALIAFGRYGRHGAPLLGLTLAIGMAVLQVAWHPGSRRARLVQFVVLDALLYYLAGGPAVVFVLFCAASEFCVTRDEPLGAATLLAGLVIPLLVGVVGYGLPVDTAFVRLLPMYAPARYEGLFPLSMLYALIVVLCAHAVLRATRRRPTPMRRGQRPPWAGRHPRLAAVLPPALALLAVVAAFDWKGGLEMRLRRAARWRDWPATLTLAHRFVGREPALETIYCTNQALLHSGQLLEAMFRFPQASLGLSLGMAVDVRTVADGVELRRWLYYDLGETTLELGLVNHAEHEACEMLTWSGPHPTVLLQLARIYTVKGNTAAVEHVLRALAKDVVHGDQARTWLKQLRTDPAAAVSAEVLAIRRHMATADVYDVGMDVLRRGDVLLAADPQNRLAADCLLGQYLLERDVAAVVRGLGRLRAAGYTALPRHVQEAVVLQEALQQGPVDCQGWTVDPELRTAYQRFAAEFQPFYAAGDAAGAGRALAARFGDSYFYYYACGGSPGMPK